jgi:hypothetical protein
MPSASAILTGLLWENNGADFYYPESRTRPHIHIQVANALAEVPNGTHVYSMVTMLAVSGGDPRGTESGITTYSTARGYESAHQLTRARARLNGPFNTYTYTPGAPPPPGSWRGGSPGTWAVGASTAVAATMRQVFDAVHAAP